MDHLVPQTDLKDACTISHAALSQLPSAGFLVVPGIVIYSLVTKVQTGGGLPSGPSGALGGVEGLSWLTTFVGIAVFANEFLSKGGLPGLTG